ncbi:MAG: HAD-IA family hydrolase [Phycisphaerales bacterium]
MLRELQSDTPVELVCFDLGGVLVRICRSWEEGCAAAALPVRESSDDENLKRLRRETTRRLTIGAIELDEWASEVARSLNNCYSPDEIVRIHHAWMSGEYEGVGAVIDRIHAVEIPTACLSNTNEAHWKRLKPANGDHPEFPSVVKLQRHFASHEMRLAKPDAEIYESFQNAVGIEPKRILFFDDLAENVEAARAAGWRARQIDHAGDTAAQIEESLIEHGVIH